MNLNKAARLLDEQYPDYFVFIRPAPGEEPESEEIAPGVKKVHHGEADETLYVEIPVNEFDDGDAAREAAEEVKNSMQSGLGLRSRVIKNAFGEGEYHHVIGVLNK